MPACRGRVQRGHMPFAEQQAQKHWNATPLYVSEEERYSAYPWLYDAAEFMHHRGERVLEIGCGTGCDLLQFARFGAVATGVDITEKHLELARERVGAAATVVYGNGCDLPFADGSFDYVYSHGVMHHCDRPDSFVGEMLRVLKPGGRFNCHVYAGWSYFTLLRRLQYGSDWRNHIENSTEPVHIDFYTAKSLRALFPFPVEITKHHAKPFEFLAPVAGFFLVAKGTVGEAKAFHDSFHFSCAGQPSS